MSQRKSQICVASSGAVIQTTVIDGYIQNMIVCWVGKERILRVFCKSWWLIMINIPSEWGCRWGTSRALLLRRWNNAFWRLVICSICMLWQSWLVCNSLLIWVCAVLILKWRARNFSVCWRLQDYAWQLLVIWWRIFYWCKSLLRLWSFHLLAKVVIRRYMSWLQRLCPQILYMFGWKTILIAFYLLYSLILFNKS